MSAPDPQPQSPLDLPELFKNDFLQLLRSALLDDNLGAGIDVSGVSGSGKSNLSELAIIEAIKLGIPTLHIDPHGGSARKVRRMALQLPKRLRDKIIFWRVADPKHVAAINPLQRPANEQQLSRYELESMAHVQIELTAEIILAAVAEAGQGFGNRPVLRKWIVRWLWMLWHTNLTLPDAAILIEPHHPLYQLLIQLAPNAVAYEQLSALPDMKVTDREAEIGSARNRITAVLEHPAATALLSRRQNTIDFRWLYEHGYSLIVDLDRGTILSEQVQRLICNAVLTMYLAVVLSTPEHQRQRRLCVIDELPVFAEACGPLLERMCTEIRKFRTSFLLLHQGSNRFPGRQENSFLQTILDMCKVKVLFRHGMDAEFFGRQVALAAHRGLRVKHVQRQRQQFTEGQEVVELVDRTTGASETDGTTVTDGTADQATQTLSNAVGAADAQTRSPTGDMSKTRTAQRTATSTSANAHTVNRSHATQRSRTKTSSQTIKQTLVPKIVDHEVVTSVEHYATDEVVWHAAAMISGLTVGDAVVIVDGIGAYLAHTPKAREPFNHAPRFAARKLDEWHQELISSPLFVTPETVADERSQFLASLSHELRRLARNTPSLPSPDAHPASPPVCDPEVVLPPDFDF